MAPVSVVPPEQLVASVPGEHDSDDVVLGQPRHEHEAGLARHAQVDENEIGAVLPCLRQSLRAIPRAIRFPVTRDESLAQSEPESFIVIDDQYTACLFAGHLFIERAPGCSAWPLFPSQARNHKSMIPPYGLRKGALKTILVPCLCRRAYA